MEHLIGKRAPSINIHEKHLRLNSSSQSKKSKLFHLGKREGIGGEAGIVGHEKKPIFPKKG